MLLEGALENKEKLKVVVFSARVNYQLLHAIMEIIVVFCKVLCLSFYVSSIALLFILISMNDPNKCSYYRGAQLLEQLPAIACTLTLNTSI